MARSDPQINLRIPAELKERVEAAARQSGRSMNAEIAMRLVQSFELPPAVEHFDFREVPDSAFDGLLLNGLNRLFDQLGERPDILKAARRRKR